MLDEFNIEAEDDSPAQIARLLCIMHAEVCAPPPAGRKQLHRSHPTSPVLQARAGTSTTALALLVRADKLQQRHHTPLRPAHRLSPHPSPLRRRSMRRSGHSPTGWWCACPLYAPQLVENKWQSSHLPSMLIEGSIASCPLQNSDSR